MSFNEGVELYSISHPALEEITIEVPDEWVKWDNRFLALAQHVAQWSKDPSTKVGAVLVQDRNRVVGLGYNGFPRGVEDSEERLADRALKYKYVVHAEVNAILMAGEKAKGATLYVWPAFTIPNICNECAKVAVQAGVKEVLGWTPEHNEELLKRWGDSIKVAKSMLDEAGILYKGLEQPK